MKLLYSLLIIQIILINYVKSQSLQFINFHSYENSQCSGAINGIGFTVVSNQCLNNIENVVNEYTQNEDSSSWIFKIIGNKVGAYHYSSQNCTGSLLNKYQFTPGSKCVALPPVINFGGTITTGSGESTSNGPLQCGIVSISDVPSLADNSLTIIDYNQDQACDFSNFKSAITITNGLTINYELDQTQGLTEFNCSPQQVASIRSCTFFTAKQSEVCQTTKPTLSCNLYCQP